MSRAKTKIFIFCSVLFLLGSCGTVKSPYYGDNAQNWIANNKTSQNKHIHSLYLIGDAGELDDPIRHRNYVLDVASEMLKRESTETSLVLLGDNIYQYGLPEEDHPDRVLSERIMDAQLKLSESHTGQTYVIPGNHDWNKYHKGGREAILRQEAYIKSYDNGKKKIRFFPKNACGDPEVVKINKDLVYVFLDSQWWLQDWSQEEKMNHKCDIESRGDLLKRIEEIFLDHKNDEIVVMLHHPIKSNGKHGGNFNLKHHLFPLTEVNNKLWIPLPIIGSIYPHYRNLTGSKQDITNSHNKELMQGMDEIAKKWRVNVVFATGHDHGMQFFDNERIKYIVSGGGSRSDYTKRGGDASYARDARGFAKIEFFENNESWLEMYTVSGFGKEPILEYRTQLREPRAGTIDEDIIYPPIDDTTVIVAANEKFAAGSIKKFFLGPQYRDIWATPVTAEKIDLETKLGGLTPIKKGGSQSSNSLRMELKDGKQYNLRSIIKDYTKMLPPELRNLKLVDVFADQNSAGHPYAALIIPTLSRAAGVFYTDPELVYLKHQRGLGNYNSQFPEELYLLEERPNGDWSDASQFGNSKEIIGYVDLLEILREKKNHFVDQNWVIKSRMFDMLIHDWDRHDDQWRWAKFEEEGKNIYRPIPRDRDQALYKFKGVIPWYISTFMMSQLKTMKTDAKDAKYLGFNAKHFDRYFLHDLEWSEWETVIKQLQEDVTDKDIDEAIKHFPEEIMSLQDVQELGGILRARRGNLMKIGKRLYNYLSKEVEITGTDNKDRFEIVQNSDGSMNVKSFVTRKDQEDLLKYDRTFYPTETKEVRLYGLRGKDSFIISGEKNNAISVRIIGGEDDDIVHNEVKDRKIYAYDNIKGMKFSGEIIDKRSDIVEVNEYDRNGFTYNTNFPLVTFGRTVDDGFWFGGSVNWTNHGWRQDPYKSKHSFSFSVAPGSRNAIQLAYDGHFSNTFGELYFAPDIEINFPSYENYFGLGGYTTNPLRETEYHWVRMKNIDIDPMLHIHISKTSNLDFGPTFRYRNIDNSPGRITDEANTVFSEDALDQRSYLGGTINYNFAFVDDDVFPTNGLSFSATATHLIELSKNENVTELNIETQAYVQLLARPKLVFANNIGFMSSYGDQQFYHYPSLGNNKGLRGYRNERFRGTSIFYTNLDLRVKLFNWNNRVIPMEVGLLGGQDFGKVIFEDGLKNPWKSSQTVGVWFELLGSMVLQPYYSFNDEQDTFSLKVGFNF